MCIALPTLGLAQSPQPVQIKELQGTVEWQSAGTTNWSQAKAGQTLQHLDHLRTKENSRVSLLWYDQSVITFGALTEIEILPAKANGQQGLQLFRGVLSFFHRDEPGRIQIITRGATAGVEGTEFVMTADEADRTTLAVVDGRVRLGNLKGSLLLTNSEQAVVEPGRAPERTAGFIANNLLQWCLYYPAVLDLHDLPLPAESSQKLATSLAAYQSGDLLAALKAFPTNQTPANNSERMYYAALLLSVGQVGQSESVMAGLSETNAATRPQQLATALRTLIAAVKRQTIQPAAPRLATEFLADSYYQQSLARRDQSLQAALNDAHAAVSNSPNFGFAWSRMAELEFMFGRTKAAFKALDQSLALAPRNAQALALKGFLLSAQNSPRAAITWFDKAIEVDSALGNAWLGRGLARIRIGDTAGGRQDLLMAAALEPQRAELRSYLGKAYAAKGEDELATKELNLAKKLDPNDPTAWLYSALQKQNNNQINDAIRDLEKSQALNDNRSVYRSQFLLDQDQAVRSANLANMYRDAGMTDVAQREAARAVNYDYANYAAHNFLASSYYQQSQPVQKPVQNNNLYEVGMSGEYLLANLLAPASAGIFSPTMGMQQHFTPFERNHLGLISSTEYLSRGAWIQSGMQYGTYDNFSYGAQMNYYSDPGQYGEDHIEDTTLALALKLGLTSQDDLFAQIDGRKRDGGDLHQYYDPYTSAGSKTSFEEKQNPNLALGYHHEWGPGSHTVLLGSRQENDLNFHSPVPTILTARFANLTTDPHELQSVIGGMSMNCAYHNRLTLYTSEAQQILEGDEHTTIVGGSFQYGSFSTQNYEDHPSAVASAYDLPPADQNIDNTMKRFSGYGYHFWQIADPLQLIGGLSYDWITYPENHLSPPISPYNNTSGQLSPKAGFIWTPLQDTTMRFAYTKSLGSQNIDQSYRLEPTQVAGFLQSFRSVIGEPSIPPNGLAENETMALAVEQKFPTGTYLGLTGEILKSKVNQTIGVFDGLWDLNDFAVPGGLTQDLHYREESLQFTANQLVGRDWALGGKYRISHVKLTDNFPEVSQNYEHLYHNPTYPFDPYQSLEGTINQVDLYVIWNLPCGFFAESDARWYGQNNSGYSSPMPGDSFWQFDAFMGYRFLQRRMQISVGLLNITDQDYMLNPLNAYSEMPRERTFVARFLFNF